MFPELLLVAGCFLWAPPQVSEPRDSQESPKRIHTEVHVYIEEEFDEEREHEEYEQAHPVEHSVRVEGAQGRATGRVSYFTRCRFRPEDQVPAPLSPLPLVSIGGKLGPIEVKVKADPFISVIGHIRQDPIATKPGLFGDGGSGGEEDSDRPILYGPDLDFLLLRDVTGWGPVRWLPESTSLHLYARALFGQFEVFDVESDLELYSAGLRLSIPLARADLVSVAAAVSAGPGFMRTDIGEAAGFESSAGLQGEFFITRRLSLLASIDASVFVSDGFFSWGPGFNAGLNIAW